MNPFGASHTTICPGNTRIVFSEGPQGEKLVSQYYPFGQAMLMKPEEGLVPRRASMEEFTRNRYLYNSKELQDDHGLNWYDYGARFYDPQIARWHVVDPLAEKYYTWTTYQYVRNNPIRRIDPNGMDDRPYCWHAQNEQEDDALRQRFMENVYGIHYNSPQGSSGGGGSRKRGEAVNDEVVGGLEINEGSTDKNLPNTLDYKNKEIITVNGIDYILYDNQWLELLPNKKYEFWLEDSSHPQGGMAITRNREEIAITDYQIRQGYKGGALGTIGSTPIWLEVLTGGFRFSPIGIIGGYGGGTIIYLRGMEKRMADHDRHVEHKRNLK
jgi:RHS repeat-associated protein